MAMEVDVISLANSSLTLTERVVAFEATSPPALKVNSMFSPATKVLLLGRLVSALNLAFGSTVGAAALLPDVEEPVPVVDEEPPDVEEPAPVVEPVLPVVELAVEPVPVVEDELADVEEPLPVVELVLPVVEPVLPDVGEPLPVVDEEVPVDVFAPLVVVLDDAEVPVLEGPLPDGPSSPHALTRQASAQTTDAPALSTSLNFIRCLRPVAPSPGRSMSRQKCARSMSHRRDAHCRHAETRALRNAFAFL